MRFIRFTLFIILIQELFSQLALDQQLQSIYLNHQMVGMSVAVRRDSTLVFAGHYGKRDLARSLPVTDSTVYRIASISKLVTSMALLKLYEEGRFGLDEDVSSYLGFQLRNPSYPSQIITFRRLLSHTGSLRDGSGYNSFLAATYTDNPPPDLQSVLLPGGLYYTADMFSASRSPDAGYFQYANINFGIIGTLIESISGVRFDLYCKQVLFDPLGLDASFNVQHLVNINNVAVLYRRSGGQWVAQTDQYNGHYPPPRDLSGYIIGNNGVVYGPQGGLRISAADLSKIMQLLMNGGRLGDQCILEPATVDLMFTSVWQHNGANGNTYSGMFVNYALGNHRSTTLLVDQVLTGHPGEAYGLISDMYFSTDGHYGIIFITNGGIWSSGAHSAWYDVEEEIFAACYANLNSLGYYYPASEPQLPVKLTLWPLFPNPFNALVTIRFSLPVTDKVWLRVFDLRGCLVEESCFEGLRPGDHQFDWNADQCPSGVYWISIETHSDRCVAKCLLLR